MEFIDYENSEAGVDNGVSVHTGFPNAATDAALQGLDLNELLIRHPASTYFMRVDGGAYRQYGIRANDILLIDRTMQPRTNDVVIWWQGEHFVLNAFQQVPEGEVIWGVVSTAIHQFRTKKTTKREKYYAKQ